MKCLDTDLLVAILRGDAEAEEKMRQLDEDGRNATTSVNAFEIFYGAYKSKNRVTNIEGTKRLLSRLDVLSLDVGAAEKAGNFFADLELEPPLPIRRHMDLRLVVAQDLDVSARRGLLIGIDDLAGEREGCGLEHQGWQFNPRRG